MTCKILRLLIGLLAAFMALTTISGGIAMLTGADQFPIEWLEGTPFNNYIIPAFILIIVVGGSALLSAITLFADRKSSMSISLVAGIVMMGYIVTEVMILKQNPPGPTKIESLYFGLGCMLFVLALYFRAIKNVSNEN